jgi:hypothetical protein
MAVSPISSTSTFYAQTATSSAVDIATAMSTLARNPRATVSIVDSAENLSRNFDTLARVANNLSGIEVKDASSDSPGVIMLSAGQYQRQARLLAKFGSSAVFDVRGITSANAATLQGQLKVQSFTVTDNSTEIGSRLGALMNMAKLQGVTITTPQTAIAVSAAQARQADNFLQDKAPTSSYVLTVTGATAVQAVDIGSISRVRSISVLDDTSGITGQLDALIALGGRLKELRSMPVDGAPPRYTVTADQLQRGSLVIGKLYRGYELAISPAPVSKVAPLMSNRSVVAVDVQDTATNIAANLATLARLGADLRSISITGVDKTLSLSWSDYRSYAGILDKITGGAYDAEDNTGGYKVALSNATVFDAQTVASDESVTRVAISDSAAALSTGLSALASNSTLMDKLQSISLTGRPQALAISAAQMADESHGRLMGKITSNYAVAVSGVKVGDVSTLTASSPDHPRRVVASVSVSDGGQAILGGLDTLAALGRRLTSITLEDSSTPLTLSASRWSSHMGTLAKIQGGYGVALTNVSAAQARNLAADGRVHTLSVRDSAANISAQLDALHELGSSVTAIVQSDPGIALSITGMQYANQSSTLAKLGQEQLLAVRNASAAQATDLAADSKVRSVAISDTSRNIANALDSLQAAIDQDKTSEARRSWTIQQSGAPQVMSISASQRTSNVDALSAITGTVQLHVSGLRAADAISTASGSVSRDRRVAAFTVSDSASQINSSLAGLAALGSRLSTIAQSDSATMSMSADKWSAYKTTLDKVAGGVRAGLTGVKAADVQTLSADRRVTSLAVSDTASQISGQLDSLQAAGPLVSSISKTDAALVSVTMSQLGTHAATLAKLDSNAVLHVRQVSVADAQLLTGNEHVKVGKISVYDTASRVSQGLSQLRVNAKLDSISLSNPNASLTLTATELGEQDTDLADAGVNLLSRIQGGYRLAVTQAAANAVTDLAARSRVSSIAVTATAASVVDNIEALNAASRKISSITLSDAQSLSLEYSQWISSQAVLGKIVENRDIHVNNVPTAAVTVAAAAPRLTSFTVLDTGANIARNLDALKAAGPSLTAISTADDEEPTLALTAVQWAAHTATLDKITDARYKLAVNSASVASVAALADNPKVVDIKVSDSTHSIGLALVELAAQSLLSSVTQTGTPGILAMTGSQYEQYSAEGGLLGKFQNGYSVKLSEVTIDGTDTDPTRLTALETDPHVSSFAVKGSPSALHFSLAALANAGKLDGIEITTGAPEDGNLISVAASDLDARSAVLDLLTRASGETYHLRVTDVPFSQLDSVAARNDLDSLTLSATSQQVSQGYEDIFAFGNKITEINLSTPSTAVAITHDQLLYRGDLVNRISGNFNLAVQDVLAADVTRALTATAALESANRITATISVHDTAQAIANNFDHLLGAVANLDDVRVSDNGDITLTAAQAQAGGDLIAKFMGEHNIVIEG